MISPSVVTSRIAQKDYDKIVATHADLINSMSLQSQKVANYNAQKKIDSDNANAMKLDMQKEQLVADTTAKRDALQGDLKREELSIKRSALSAV